MQFTIPFLDAQVTCQMSRLISLTELDVKGGYLGTMFRVGSWSI